jgi:uncharacterized protein (DUF58 family)
MTAVGSRFDDAFLRKLEYLAVVSRRLVAGRMRGERRSRKAGSGIEFADHRDYAAGDDLRYLDWNLYGRLDRLLVRLFEEEEDLLVYVLLDASGSMRLGQPPKLAHASQLAAALAYIALCGLDRVTVVPFGGPPRLALPPARGKGRIFKLFEFLAAIDPEGTTDLADAARTLVHRHKRPGLVLLLSDLYDRAGAEGAVSMLLHHRFEPAVVHVTDAMDAAPDLRGDLEIVDAETDEAVPVTVSGALATALAAEHERLLSEAAQFCARRAVPYFRAPIAEPFDQQILRMFRQGGFLR